MRIHQLNPAEALSSLQSRESGLSMEEARCRLREYGLNQFPRARRQPIIWTFLKEFTHFFAVVLWFAAALAFIAAWRDGGQAMGTLGGAIVAVIVINGMFSFWQMSRAERSLAALEKLLPHQVKALRGESFVQLSAAELVPGDIISIEAGDLIPADCRLIEAFDVRVDTATVSGESVPVVRTAGAAESDDLWHAGNVLLAGTTLVAGTGRAVIFATGSHTEFGKIAHLTQTAGDDTFPLQRQIHFLSRVVTCLAAAMGIVFFLIGLTIPLSFTDNFLFAIGIIVANVPEGLLPTVTLSLAMGAQRMARRNVLIRRLPAVETLGSTTVICTDKTGTLTENRMRVRQLYLGGEFHDISENDRGIATLAEDIPPFFEALSCCHNLKESHQGSERTWLGDPMEIALVELARRVGRHDPATLRIDEIGFDSDRRRLSTIHQSADGLVLYCKGALESLLPLCIDVRKGREKISLENDQKHQFIAAQEQMAANGLRVLAVAVRHVLQHDSHDSLEQNLTLLGLVGLDDPPRPEVPEAVARCRQAGIRIIMITGDHPRTAVSIGRQIGLLSTESPVVMTGDVLSRISDTQLQLTLDAPEVVFARIRADQKMRIVSVLQRKGEIVAVTGDGVNDAPALRQADIGIAMGATGTDVARETADMILTDDNFANIVAAVEEGRTVFDNIRKFLTYILTSNIPEIVPYISFVLFKIPLPLTILQILAVDLGTDMLPALALGAEAPDPDVMRRPPRPRNSRILDGPLLARSYLFLGMLEAAAAMSVFFIVLIGAGWRYGETIDRGHALFATYQTATTACLTAIVVAQIANVFLCRSERRSILRAGLSGNKLIWWGIAFELTLIAVIDYTPWGNLLFATTPIGWNVWLFAALFAIVMIVMEEGRKWLLAFCQEHIPHKAVALDAT